MPFADSNGCKLYFEVRGESGSPVMMIAGYGSSIAGWHRPLVDGLAERHRVVLFDNRGVGQSDKPDEPYSMAQFADDAAVVLDAAGIEQAHVLGTSMGGMIAQHFALRHPQRLLGLVLGCTVPADMESEEVVAPKAEVIELLLAPRDGDPADSIRKLWPIFFSSRFIQESSAQLEAELLEQMTYPETPQYALECQMHAITKTHNVLDRLHEITCPTLVLTGDSDVLIPPQNSHIIASRIRNATLIEYPGVGHVFTQEVDQAVIDDAIAFFSRVDEERS